MIIEVQGSIIGLILFPIYFNDSDDTVSATKSVHFADDKNIIFTIADSQSLQGAAWMVSRVGWILMQDNNNFSKRSTIIMNDKPITRVNDVKHPGVTYNDEFSYNMRVIS